MLPENLTAVIARNESWTGAALRSIGTLRTSGIGRTLPGSNLRTA